MRNRLLELTFLTLAVAVGMRLWAPRQQSGAPPAPSSPARSALAPWQDNRINGVGSRDTMDSAESLLGVAACRGRLRVGKRGQENGFYEEWGGSNRITWEGSPTLTFYADKSLLCSIGDVLSLGDTNFAIGSPRKEIEAVFGHPSSSESTDAGAYCTYRDPDQSLHLTYNHQGQLSKILRESLR